MVFGLLELHFDSAHGYQKVTKELATLFRSDCHLVSATLYCHLLLLVNWIPLEINILQIYKTMKVTQISKGP